MKLLLTHVPQARRQYYGARALARLQELLEVTLHEGEAPLDTAGVIAMARGADFIIADRVTPVPAEVFAGLPGLKVVMTSAGTGVERSAMMKSTPRAMAITPAVSSGMSPSCRVTSRSSCRRANARAP